MPEVEQKTPVYDVMVQLEDQTTITIRHQQLKEVAKTTMLNLQHNMSGTYWYDEDEMAWLNKNYIVRCWMKPSTTEEYVVDYGYGRYLHTPVYYEDLND